MRPWPFDRPMPRGEPEPVHEKFIPAKTLGERLHYSPHRIEMTNQSINLR